ncbi:zinc finger MYM-type protein 1-like [Aphis craccivora]|uniref:Zinc finger MYM-type protein 1-like n=1 Tax=Aphis craccivora TaxID=307492 RepID=A0A6G0Y283_APHCR|nr:zinc finger MYM-type protein 1-like [Aphis craccivora]
MELLRFRDDAGDKYLENHLIKCAKNDMYTKWRIQNEILTTCNILILQHLVKNINAAKSFKILADKTSDISNKAQLTLCIRYVNSGEKKLREDFLQFFEVKNMSAVMSGMFNGTQSHIRKKYPMALYIHCSSHCLNLAVSFACQISEIRNCMGTMQTISNFFGYPKRLNILQSTITKIFPEEISSWTDVDTSSTATQSKFQVSLMILVKLFSISVPLSRLLQIESLDLKQALSFANVTQNTLKDIRLNAVEEFNKIFKSVETYCNKIGIDVCIPRISSRQVLRNQLHDRFISHENILSRFTCLFPNSDFKISNDIEESFKLLSEMYKDVIYENNLGDISKYLRNAELQLWKNSSKHQSDIIQTKKTVTDLYFQCDPQIYPIISKLLQIFITLPVTTATGERSFSTLRCIKTYLRNTTGQNRLNSLALLNIHRDIEVDSNDIINEMSKSSNKRLKLNL